MIKVAARLYDYEEYRELAKEYLGNGNVVVKECGVSPKNNIVSGFETDSQHVAKVVAGNVDIKYSINENGNIVLDSAFVAERLGTQEKIYIFDENNNLTILNVKFKEKLSSQTDWTEIKDT